MDTDIGALTTIFTEFYYWVTVALMFLIHVGFCMYEVGASRTQEPPPHADEEHDADPAGHHHLVLLRLVDLLGAFRAGRVSPAVSVIPIPELGGRPIYAVGRGHGDRGLDDRISGVFWAAFLLFAWTAASIVSGAVIERIRSFAFWLIAIVIGSVTWSIDAAWGWHSGRLDGHRYPGLPRCLCLGRDPCASRAAARLACWSCLGPRLGKFAPTATPQRHLAAQPLAGLHRAVPDLHRLLGLLRGLQRADHRS